MNRITKLLSILMIISFGFSTDNEESETTTIDRTTVVEPGTEQSSGIVDQDRTLAPGDIEKINNIRINKNKVERSHAKAILMKHRQPKVASTEVENPNFEALSIDNAIKSQIKKDSKVNFIKKFTQSLRSKYTVQTLEKEDGKRAIKFPTDSGSK